MVYSLTGVFSQLVLNPYNEETARTKGLEQINFIIVKQYALRKEAYDMRYGQVESNQEPLVVSSSQNLYRSTMKDLYLEILKFEAKVVRFPDIKAKDAPIQEFALIPIKARLQVADSCFRLLF